MRQAYSLEEIARAIEKCGREDFIERAANEFSSLLARENLPTLFLCGKDDFGAAGFLAAQNLLSRGIEAKVFCPFSSLSPFCKKQREAFSGEILLSLPKEKFPIVCDCLSSEKELIPYLNECGGKIYSFDLPLGIRENGAAEEFVKADVTFSIGEKCALQLWKGAEGAGEIVLSTLDLPLTGGVSIWEEKDLAPFFPRRKSTANKGDFGSVSLFLSSPKLSGAIFLSAEAALKSGAGYVKLHAKKSLLKHLMGRLPQVMLLKNKELSSSAIAFGMGAGATKKTYRKVKYFLKNFKGSLILDADALNALSRFGLGILKQKSCKVILTPHPGEFARLMHKTVHEVLEHALEDSKAFAKEYGVILMLKNNRTIVTDGNKTTILTSGSPALSKGGSGDVLAGFLAGTCARGVEPYSAACVSSYLVGKAGEIAGRELGEYASDPRAVIERIPKAILSCI